MQCQNKHICFSETSLFTVKRQLQSLIIINSSIINLKHETLAKNEMAGRDVLNKLAEALLNLTFRFLIPAKSIEILDEQIKSIHSHDSLP